MIKTLRITSIIAVLLAIVFFVVPAVFGFRGDKQIEQFLNSAGAIEGFSQAKGEKGGDSQREVSPLVRQRELFALYLNPPPKPTPAPSMPEIRSEPRPMGLVTAKFQLIGTSRHLLQPELSLALIDEPGKGLYWVRQSSKIGHLVIEQVRDGVVVVRDGQNTFELVAERPEKRSLIKEDTLSGGRITGGLLPETAGEIRVGAKEGGLTEAEVRRIFAELEATDVGAKAAQAEMEVSESGSSSEAEEISAE